MGARRARWRFVALWLLVRSRRERLARVLGEQADVEVAAGFLLAVCAAAVLVSAFLSPTIAGPWFGGRQLVVGPAAARRAGELGPAALPAHRSRARRRSTLGGDRVGRSSPCGVAIDSARASRRRAAPLPWTAR